MTELPLALLIAGYALSTAALRTGRDPATNDAHRLSGSRSAITMIAAVAPTLMIWSPALSIIAAAMAIVRVATHARGATALHRFTIEHVPQLALLGGIGLAGLIDVTQPFVTDLLTPWWQLRVGGQAIAASWVLYPAAVVIVTLVGADFVATVLNPHAVTSDETTTTGRGRTIGMLERLPIVLLVVGDEWGGIGFVIAAKSLARFKEFDDRDFAEYYLIGTLTSSLFAIAVGVVLTI